MQILIAVFSGPNNLQYLNHCVQIFMMTDLSISLQILVMLDIWITKSADFEHARHLDQSKDFFLSFLTSGSQSLQILTVVVLVLISLDIWNTICRFFIVVVQDLHIPKTTDLNFSRRMGSVHN